MKCIRDMFILIGEKGGENRQKHICINLNYTFNINNNLMRLKSFPEH